MRRKIKIDKKRKKGNSDLVQVQIHHLHPHQILKIPPLILFLKSIKRIAKNRKKIPFNPKKVDHIKGIKMIIINNQKENIKDQDRVQARLNLGTVANQKKLLKKEYKRVHQRKNFKDLRLINRRKKNFSMKLNKNKLKVPWPPIEWMLRKCQLVSNGIWMLICPKEPIPCKEQMLGP